MSQTQTQAQPFNDERIAINAPIVHRFLPNAPLMALLKVMRKPDPQRPNREKITGVLVYWFDDHGGYQKEVFDSRALRPATEQEIITAEETARERQKIRNLLALGAAN